jgi:hypothetical protein
VLFGDAHAQIGEGVFDGIGQRCRGADSCRLRSPESSRLDESVAVHAGYEVVV